MKLAKIE